MPKGEGGEQVALVVLTRTEADKHPVFKRFLRDDVGRKGLLISCRLSGTIRGV
jgi:hypothetical protein